MISETSKWKYQRERALTYSVLAENTKNGTKSPFFMICLSLPLSISSHLRKEKPTHTQLQTQQLKVQQKRNPKYPYQQMERRNQEWLIPILANMGLLGFDKERRFGSILGIFGLHKTGKRSLSLSFKFPVSFFLLVYIKFLGC